MGSVGRDLNILELEGMASEPKDDNIFSVDSIRFLDDMFDELVFSVCNGEYCNSLQSQGFNM